MRAAFKMNLNEGCAAEYKKRHDEIYPDLVKALEDAGVYDYSIFLDEETNTLFAFQKLTDDNTAAKLPELDIVQKWWAMMSDIMEYNDDNTPVAIGLKEVFHMD